MKKYIITILATCIIAVPAIYVTAKQADLAGSWYSASPEALKREITGYLENVSIEKIDGNVIGAIAPHAGIKYSGPIAAFTYKALTDKDPDTVIVVGFTHRKHYPYSVSVFNEDSYITPLGAVAIDKSITSKLIAYDKSIRSIPVAFVSENSIELEIPFIQVTLNSPKLVLIAICDQNIATCSILADALHDVLKDEKNFVMIASADMSHHLPYDVAEKIDAKTIESIKQFDPGYFFKKSLECRNDQRMCGFGAVYSVMEASRKLGADKARILKYANSGDVTGVKSSVVGYMSAVFIETDEPVNEDPGKEEEEGDMFNAEQHKQLLTVARDTIRHYLETGERLDPKVDDEMLKQDMGTFVTLHKNGQLRGCIGHMEATGPLCTTVRDMAIAAATGDPRFPAVTIDELDDIDIEISALSPMKKIDDYNQLKIPGQGVMVRMGWRGGVYLPQVAEETGWTRDEFMDSLCAHKAGIPKDAWKTGECDIYVFTAEVFGERDK